MTQSNSFQLLRKSMRINKQNQQPLPRLLVKKEIVSSVSVDVPIGDRIENLELNDELKKSFMSYAMSTILGRCLPDARDGK